MKPKKSFTLDDVMSNSPVATHDPKPEEKVELAPVEPALLDASGEIRSNKLFYIKRKYVEWMNREQLKEGFKYSNDYLEHIIEFYQKNRP